MKAALDDTELGWLRHDKLKHIGHSCTDSKQNDWADKKNELM